MKTPEHLMKEVVSLHHEGRSTREIADYTGLHRSTVRRILVRLGEDEPKLGPVRRESCPRGHSMEDSYVRRDGRGGRDCRHCKKARGQRAYRNQMLMKAILEIQGNLPTTSSSER